MQGNGFDGRVFDRLENAFPWIWAELAAAIADRHSPWRTPVLATAGLTGAPRARTVVLRGVEAEGATLTFFTDRRAGKAADIAVRPDASVLFYNAESRVQMRAEGKAGLTVSGEAADAAWAALPVPARALYATELPPGAPFPGGAPATQPDGRDNFMLLQIVVARLELLWLGPDRHRRCAFDRTPGKWDAAWVIP